MEIQQELLNRECVVALAEKKLQNEQQETPSSTAESTPGSQLVIAEETEDKEMEDETASTTSIGSLGTLKRGHESDSSNGKEEEDQTKKERILLKVRRKKPFKDKKTEETESERNSKEPP